MEKTKLSHKQLTDAGMALVLILLLLAYFVTPGLFIVLAIASLVVNMVYPSLLYPFALVWYQFSYWIGLIIPPLILTVIFFVLIVPVGLLRRLFVVDKLYLKSFKKQRHSVYHKLDHTYSAADFEKPY